jgi:hydrogenase maturation protein HypF
LTFHLHIKGRVQGVGFRPHIYQYGVKNNINGYVSNEPDGVHVVFNHSSLQNAEIFASGIIKDPPARSIIQSYYLEEFADEKIEGFFIRVQDSDATPDLLISPDFAICPACTAEFHDTGNRRHGYPFITCTLCGPRYSIMSRLPYERHLTAMNAFIQCTACYKEYNDVSDGRYFSQTNSCPECGVIISWHPKNGGNVLHDQSRILTEAMKAIDEGKIIAVKGIGGFLLLCDASNKKAVATLRARKHRPRKPFALLFPDVVTVSQYAYASPRALEALSGYAAPIVVLQATAMAFEKLHMEEIAPGLSSIGIMLPYAPILEWIMATCQKPLIATSGNLAGSCIVFDSSKKEVLFDYADYLLNHDRDILIPQDDSVVRFAELARRQVIIRRARGMAPAMITGDNVKSADTLFASGAMLKSTFAIQHNRQVYVSQFLGNLESYDTQQNYQHTLRHFLTLLKAAPGVILADLHPGYPSTLLAGEYGSAWAVPVKKIQHHEAHFAAVLGEYNLFSCNEKILGVIWDGTGYGTDGNVWGGEFFIYEKGTIERVLCLEPFVNIAGDKIAKEPRLAALAVCHDIEEAHPILQGAFTEQEWSFYKKAITSGGLQNTSAGRYFDAVAALLGLTTINTYEGEASLALEQLARNYLSANDFNVADDYEAEEPGDHVIKMRPMIRRLVTEIRNGQDKGFIATKYHNRMASIIYKVAGHLQIKKIACSGGVFQNTVLLDLMALQLKKMVYLESDEMPECYFHTQLPPNDECISFGQLMHYQHIKS